MLGCSFTARLAAEEREREANRDHTRLIHKREQGGRVDECMSETTIQLVALGLLVTKTAPLFTIKAVLV